MNEELPTPDPEEEKSEAPVEMAPETAPPAPKRKAKKKGKKKAPMPMTSSDLASGAEAWVESHKKEAGRTAALEQILQDIERYEESGRDPHVLEALPYDATEVIMEAKASNGNDED